MLLQTGRAPAAGSLARDRHHRRQAGVPARARLWVLWRTLAQDEFPFAGHPTLGTAHALLEAGFQPKTPGVLVQECGVGLVPVRIAVDDALAFRALPALFGPMDAALLPPLQAILGTAALDTAYLPVVADMGIRWLIVRLIAAADCLAVKPNGAALDELMQHTVCDGLAIYGPYLAGGVADYEVRDLVHSLKPGERQLSWPIGQDNCRQQEAGHSLSPTRSVRSHLAVASGRRTSPLVMN